MKRRPPDKVAKYMFEEDPELRLAAVTGAERGRMTDLVDRLINRLEDKDERVARAAQTALESLTGQKHDSPDAWKRWLSKSRKQP